ncbi:transposable element Tcb2 transposase [Trichonephila clavipes]|nr:transposable element Tcb2 transposase [Trichonephila clavipes]
MAVNDCTASSRQLAAHWSTDTGVLMSALSIRQRLLHRGLHARVPLYKIPFTANYRWLRLQWTHDHHELIGIKLTFPMNHVSIWGTMMAAFMVDAMPVNAAFLSALSDDIYSGLTHGVMPNTCNFFLGLLIPIEYLWDLVGRRLARDPRPVASKDELLLYV